MNTDYFKYNNPDLDLLNSANASNPQIFSGYLKDCLGFCFSTLTTNCGAASPKRAEIQTSVGIQHYSCTITSAVSGDTQYVEN